MAASIRRVIVLYPRGARTGGPKCLHQLVHALRRRGVEAFLCPLQRTAHRPRVPEYEIYDAPENRLTDDEDVIVLTPETSFREVVNLKKARIGIWWLSIDFAVGFELEKARQRGESLSKVARIAARNIGTGEMQAWKKFQRTKMLDSLHFSHSTYCQETVRSRLGLDAAMLSDYTEMESRDVQKAFQKPIDRSEDLVVFNPKKGGHLARYLAKLMPDIQFAPVSGLSRSEVVELLRTATAYLDLGHFPGKDHLPREAARCGTPVLLAKRGSAAFRMDFPLPDEYLVRLSSPSALETARMTLRDIVRAPNDAVSAQTEFRASVEREKHIFEREVDLFTARLGSPV